MSEPLPGIAEAKAITIADDGTASGSDTSRHHRLRARRPVAQVAKLMIEKEIHAVVVMDGGRATGVVSQTDLVLARQVAVPGGSGIVGQHDRDPRLRHTAPMPTALERGGQPDDQSAHASLGGHRKRSIHRRDLHDRCGP